MNKLTQTRHQLAVKSIALAMAGAGLLSLPQQAMANPTGGQVISGNVTIRQESTSKVSITQSTDKGIIDWQKFSIGANEQVQFYQPSASSVTLNRVVGQDPSQILGRLTANGQVFLVNPNGIYFGKNAQIDVAGLVASTHNIRNEDFLAGNYQFSLPGQPGAAVINEGTIRIADTGIAAFVAPSVANRGVIVARLGKVALTAANGFTLDFHGDQLLSFLVNDDVAQTAFDIDGKQLTSFVENAGRIEAQGGRVLLTAKAAENAIHGVINHSGVIEATTVNTKNGEIILNAGTGSLWVAGTLDASAQSGGDGGFIETSGARVSIDPGTKINTAAPYGKNGLWLIDPVDITINGGMATAIISALQSGDVTITTSGNNTPSTVSGETSGNGDIFVNGAIGWSANKFTLVAHRNININAGLTASGTGKLALQYGQATVNGSGSDYFLRNGAQINLPAGENFSTKQGWGSPVITYTVITALGAANSTTGQDLQGMNGALARNYVLGSDIDASATRNWNSGAGFKPIGQLAATFTGKLDGLGHQISNLFINRPNESEVGFFGSMTNSIVRNIGLENVDITAGERIGGVAGTMRWGSSLQNVYATGTVTGVSSGVINGQPSNAGAVGGLVGVATPYYYGGNTWCGSCINIDTSYANVNVTGNTSLGGIAGVIDQTNIRNSYATGNVTSTNSVSSATGGLVGYLFSSSVTNSYAAGRVQGGASYVGGLIGWRNSFIPTTNYWDTDTSGQLSSLGGTGKTTTQMQQQATYTGWDFDNTWVISSGQYPTLRNNPVRAAAVTPVTPVANTNAGTTLSATYVLPDAGQYAALVASAIYDVPKSKIIESSDIFDQFIDKVAIPFAISTTEYVSVSLSDKLIANIKSKHLSDLADISARKVGLLNKINVDGLSDAERKALQSVYAKSARAWYGEAHLTKTKVAENTATALGIAGVLAVLQDSYTAYSLTRELEELIVELPFLKDKIPDQAWSELGGNVTVDLGVVVGSYLTSKFLIGYMGKSLAGGVVGVTVGVLLDGDPVGEASTQKMPSDADSAVSWAKANSNLALNIESYCGKNPKCIESGTSMGGAPGLGIWEFYKIKRDYFKALGEDTSLYDWVDKYQEKPGEFRLVLREI